MLAWDGNTNQLQSIDFSFVVDLFVVFSCSCSLTSKLQHTKEKKQEEIKLK